MHPAIIGAVFGLVFIGELPDKSMFASLVMSARGRPLPVWIGASSAFLVHVVIAVSIGVGLFQILPHRALDLVVAALFAVAAVVAFAAARANGEEEYVAPVRNADPTRVALTAFVVIFLAEWGDVTQVLTANLAARYHSPLSVGIGATLGLWAVSGLAVVGGHGLLARLPTRPLRLVMGGVLAVLAVFEIVAAFR